GPLAPFVGFGALCHTAQVPILSHVGPQLAVYTTSIGEAPQQGRLSSLDKLHYSVTGDLPAEEDCDPLADWAARRSTERHNIVPGTIPTGTPLYHGTWHSELPPGPDWTAFDPEHSVVFCGSSIEDGRCWHLTLMTTRPLNVSYVDGTSSAKLSTGTLDSHDIVAWGDARPDWSFDEWSKITTFEVMFCNFTSGVRVISFSNIVDPVMSRNTSSGFSRTFEVMYATLVRPDLSGLVSFYDIELVPSLDHRLLNISTEDAVRTGARLEEALSRQAGSSNSVIDDAIKIQVQLRHIVANVKGKASDVLGWARPVYKLCATTHTDRLQDCNVTSSEKLLLDAVQGTTREICRVDQFIGTDREPDVETTQNVMNTWRKDINELMTWLDWKAWVKCRPECGPEEMCYLTTWPVGFPPPNGRARIPRPDDGGVPPLPW
ncbi:hypothetical protein BKA83DRAFT_4316986, partial [Pisolithus microcarpus]